MLVDWSPDGRTLAVATTEGEVALVEPDTGQAKVVRRGVRQPVKLAVGNGTRGLVVSGAERAWQFGTWASKTPTEGVAPVGLAALGPSHAVLPLGDTFRHTDLRGGRARTLEWDRPPVGRIVLGADGRALMLGVDGSWTVWDATRRKTRSYGTQALSSVAVDPTGRFLVVGTTTGGLWTWSIERAAPAAIDRTGGGAVRALDVDALGRVLWADDSGMGMDARRWFEDGVSAVALDGDRVLGFGNQRVVAVLGSEVYQWPIAGLGTPVDVRGAGDDWSALEPDGRRLTVELDRRVAGTVAGAVPRPGTAGGVGPTWRAVVEASRGAVTLHGPIERSLAVDDATAAAVDERNGRVWTVGEDGCIRSWDLETGALRAAWWVGPDGQWAAWDERSGWRSGGMTITRW
jgi:WD40 repeat protein